MRYKPLLTSVHGADRCSFECETQNVHGNIFSSEFISQEGKYLGWCTKHSGHKLELPCHT